MRMIILAGALISCVSTNRPLCADWFGTGHQSFEIEFVTIGDPGNSGDSTGSPSMAGTVNYSYRIAKFETPHDAITKVNAASSAAGTPLYLTTNPFLTPGPNHPATCLSWLEVTRFVNWLNTSSGYPPAYNGNASWAGTDGYDSDNPYRNKLAKYFLPTQDEWYKAAYYDPVKQVYYNYATGSDDAPLSVWEGTSPFTAVYDVYPTPDYPTGFAEVTKAGGLSPYGTMAQSGNVWEFTENRGGRNDWLRFSRGGGYASRASQLSPTGVDSLSYKGLSVDGFRVASRSIPEPSTLTLFAAVCAIVGYRLRR